MAMKKYDVIVIGAGIGGLGAALMLAHKGKHVLILEKNKFLGGRLMSYQKEGFIVDLGIHIISQSFKGPLGQVLERVGKTCNIKFKLIRPITSYKGETFLFPHDLKKRCGEKEFNAVMEALSDIRSFSEEQVSSYDEISTRDFFDKYIKDPLSKACINNISTIYMCLPYWKTSAGEFMRCMRSEAKSKASGYPEGGCGAITNMYVEAFKDFGGEILTGAEVTNIEIRDGGVRGVYVGEEYYEAEMIVSNADIKGTMLKLVNKDKLPADYTNYVNNLEYSWTGPIMRLALDKVLTDVPMLTQIGTTDPEGYYRDLEKGIVADELNFFMVSPSNFSSKVAPAGKQLINIGPPMPIGTPASLKEDIKEGYFRTLEKYIPGFRDHIIWMEYIFIDGLGKLIGEKGAGIGIGQTPTQSGKNRPPIKTPIDGLYIVGAEAGGYGVGIELALNSAMEFIDNYT